MSAITRILCGYRVGKTHCQGHQDPSKRVPIFLGTPEALIKMVPICAVPISRLRTVKYRIPARQGALHPEILHVTQKPFDIMSADMLGAIIPKDISICLQYYTAE